MSERPATEAEKQVFGHNVKIVDGQPVEQGFGSLANPNKRAHEAALAQIEKIQAAKLGGGSSVEIAKLLRDLLAPGLTPEQLAKLEHDDNNRAMSTAVRDERISMMQEAIEAKEKQIAELMARVDAAEKQKADTSEF